mgnify:CR=1 FL=1
MTDNVILGITGASGGPYALAILDGMEKAGFHVHLIISPHGRHLLADECGIRDPSPERLLGRSSDRITVHPHHNLNSQLASGSFSTRGMIICPCTSNTLGAIAGGLGDNLIRRAAHVTLKEARRLIIVHREMPLSGIDLENMVKLQRVGAVICPASPGFYLHPSTVSDLVHFVAGRVLDLLAIPHPYQVRYQPDRHADSAEKSI